MSKLKIIQIILFVLLFISEKGISHKVFGQEQMQFRFQNFTESQGLPSQYVYSATQDQNDQIWIGTSSGLYSFDNRYFRHYQPKNQSPGRDINNLLHFVYWDKITKKIWCASYNNLMYLDPKTKSFSQANLGNPKMTNLVNAHINYLFRDSKGRMWASTMNDGWGMIEEKTNAYTSYYEKKALTNKLFTNKIIESKDGRLWVLHDTGIIEFSQGKKSLKSYKPQSIEGRKFNFSDCIYDEKRNVFWISAYSNGLFMFDLATEKFTYIHNSRESLLTEIANERKFTALQFYKSDKIILNGSHLYDINSQSFDLISNYTIPEFEYHRIRTASIFSDKEKNLWFCSHTGLSVMSRQSTFVQHIPILNPISKNAVEIYSLLSLTKELFMTIGEKPGLIKLSKNQKSTAIQPEDEPNFFAYSILKMSEGEMLVASSIGLYQYSDKKGQLIRKKTNLKSTEITKINFMYLDKAGRIILCIRGVGIYRETARNSSRFEKLLIKNLDGKTVNALCEGEKNTLWAAVDDYIFKFSSNDNKTEIFKSTKSKILLQFIKKMKVDKNGHLWCVNTTNGLFEGFIQNKEWQFINHNEIKTSGLNSSFINGFDIDEKGRLWLNSPSSLVLYNTQKRCVTSTFNLQHGFSNSSFTRTIDVFPNGLLYCTAYSSLDILNLSKVLENPYLPRPLISNLVIGKTEFNQIPNQTLELASNEGYLRFDLGSTGYGNINRNNLKYQLVGLDKEWRVLDLNYTVTYSSLPPGDYQLFVQIGNNIGHQKSYKMMTIKVLYPFYLRWWFLLFVLLFIIFILTYLSKIKANSIRREERLSAEYSQQVAELEMKALRAQMNPHFMFNALNSIQKFILKNETQIASEYLTKFSRLIRMILDQSEQTFTLLEDEITLLTLYTDLEKMRFDAVFNFVVNVDPTIDATLSEIPCMFIQPFIENSIWHGILHKSEPGEIRLSIKKESEKYLFIQIEDNGIGREEAAKVNTKSALSKKSYGMKITKERLSALKLPADTIRVVDLKDEFGNAKGTKVEIRLPYKVLPK